MSIIPILGAAAAINATNAARMASTSAMLTASRLGGAAVSRYEDSGKIPSASENTGWIGVQCCPACLSPIGGSLPKCCSICGHTEDVYINTKIRSGRYENGVWRWKDGRGVLDRQDSGIALAIYVLLAFFAGLVATLLIIGG